MIESRLDRGRGPVGTMLVQRGTLQQGDIVVAGAEWGRVRAMLDDKGKPITYAGPSTPVEILGLSGAPIGRRAVRGGGKRRPRARNHRIPPAPQREKTAGVRLARAARWIRCWPASRPACRRKSPSLIKADVQGSAEAIQATVMKLEHEEVKVRVLLSGVGQITESDVQLAKASRR